MVVPTDVSLETDKQLNCKECSSSFIPYRDHQVYCSKKCRMKKYQGTEKQKKYHKKYYQENYGSIRAKQNVKERERNAQFPEKKMLITCRNRAKSKQLPFNLEEKDIFIPSICPILGVPLTRHTQYAPSLDRINPAKGYVKGNVQVISQLANVMKNNASPEQLRKFAEWVIKTY